MQELSRPSQSEHHAHAGARRRQPELSRPGSHPTFPLDLPALYTKPLSPEALCPPSPPPTRPAPSLLCRTPHAWRWTHTFLFRETPASRASEVCTAHASSAGHPAQVPSASFSHCPASGPSLTFLSGLLLVLFLSYWCERLRLGLPPVYVCAPSGPLQSPHTSQARKARCGCFRG